MLNYPEAIKEVDRAELGVVSNLLDYLQFDFIEETREQRMERMTAALHDRFTAYWDLEEEKSNQQPKLSENLQDMLQYIEKEMMHKKKLKVELLEWLEQTLEAIQMQG